MQNKVRLNLPSSVLKMASSVPASSRVNEEASASLVDDDSQRGGSASLELPFGDVLSNAALVAGNVSSMYLVTSRAIPRHRVFEHTACSLLEGTFALNPRNRASPTLTSSTDVCSGRGLHCTDDWSWCSGTSRSHESPWIRL